MVEPLDQRALTRAARLLAERDPVLGEIHRAHGDPPLWARYPGFETLAWIVLGQQVSLASANAALERLRVGCGGNVTAASVRSLGFVGIRACGLTRQKSGYLLDLATAIQTRSLDLDALAVAPDEQVRATLVEQRGIGAWSADIYLLMALRRPDVWPTADLALIEAVRHVAGWRDRPSSGVAADYATRWQPWRSVAARMLWQSYLVARGRPLE
jgi:DNA-3-methyladenine glycosylase II